MSNHKIERHTWGLREALFAEWEGMRSGKIDPKRALASAKIAQAIMQTVDVEMRLAKQWNGTKEGAYAAVSSEFRLGKP